MAEYRRRLPHFHPDGEHLFVTWRLHGSLPVAPLDVIYATPGHRFAVEDRALAQSHARLWMSNPRVARQVVEAIRTGESRKLYELHAWVVMPNHVHMLILPHVPLPQITHWIKGRTAREANLLLKRTGEPFWQHESWDHWVRNEREFHRIVAYIEENRFRQGWLARLGLGHGQAPHRQAKACPTEASTLRKQRVLLDFFDLRRVARGM